MALGWAWTGCCSAPRSSREWLGSVDIPTHFRTIVGDRWILGENPHVLGQPFSVPRKAWRSFWQQHLSAWPTGPFEQPNFDTKIEPQEIKHHGGGQEPNKLWNITKKNGMPPCSKKAPNFLLSTDLIRSPFLRHDSSPAQWVIPEQAMEAIVVTSGKSQSATMSNKGWTKDSTCSCSFDNNRASLQWFFY